MGSSEMGLLPIIERRKLNRRKMREKEMTRTKNRRKKPIKDLSRKEEERTIRKS
jgi:hypothetical protein